jgi:hypothetical protein
MAGYGANPMRHIAIRCFHRFWLGVSLALAPCLAVEAHTFCVTNATGLESALTAASDGGANAAEDNTIEIAAGTYATTTAPFTYFSTSGFALHVQGGYDAACTTQTQSARLSVMDGGHATQVMNLASTNGLIVVSNLTIRNGSSHADGGGLFLDSTSASTETRPGIFNTILENNTTTAMGGGFYMHTTGMTRTYLLTNLISGNSAGGGYGAGVIDRSSFNITIIDNNTITRNSSSNGNSGGLLYTNLTVNGGYCDVENDIFWNNGLASFSTGNGSLSTHIGSSVYDVIGGNGVGEGIENSQQSDPLFVDPDAGNFRLGNGSPALGIASFRITGFDLDGHAVSGLIYTGSVDAGAYSDTIFGDAFEETLVF